MLRLSLVLVLALISAPWAAAAEAINVSDALAEVLSSRHPRNVDDLRLLESHVQKIAEQAAPATIGIEVGRSMGSGVVVSSDGLVLTAAHVIGRPGRSTILLLPDGRQLKGVTLGANYDIDAGMVQIKNPPTDLPFVPVAKEAQPEIGQWVVATGQPGGTLEDRDPPIRLGRVLASEQGWICTDCTLVGGDSGGPLLNMHGEVTGIHTSIGPSIVHNFHVPVSLIQEDWQRLVDGEVWGGGAGDDESFANRPVLGISGRTEDDHCQVTRVFPGLPAQLAGVEVGDLILSVDGMLISSFDEVAKLVTEKHPGATLRLLLQRDDQHLEVDVVLSAVRMPLPEDSQPEADEP